MSLEGEVGDGMPRMGDLRETIEAQERYIVRLRAALRTLGKTTAEIDAIVVDSDKVPDGVRRKL